MKLYCLSGNPNKPCSVLAFKNCTIMLDCGLDMTSASYFLPLPLVPSNRLSSLNSWMPRDGDADAQLEGELKECEHHVFIDSPPEFFLPVSGLIEFSEIDAILVSNYLNILALPYITNNTGFKGVVLMTEPTLQLGRLFMEEFVTYIERTPRAKHAKRWKNLLGLLPSPFCDLKSPKTWKHAYNMKDISTALSHVRIIAYNEKIIAYMSTSSILTTHPRPMDQQPLKNADILILTALSHTPMQNPNDALKEFCLSVASTLRNGGNVLVPCYPSGIVYDLFEYLSSHLDNIGLSHIPMYFVSPVADSSLAYSNIFSEWLSTSKQSKVYQEDDPFPHAFLIQSGRLKAFKYLHAEGFSTEYRQPCIVFCGHPSMRFGDAVHFMELWGSSPLNTVLFTEPEFDSVEALAPYQILAMRSVTCPIDTRLNFTQARKLIADLKPKKLVTPLVYTQPPVNALLRTDLTLDLEEEPTTYKEYDIIDLGIQRKLEKIVITSELAKSLNPVIIRPGISAVTINAELHVHDNKYVLKPIQNGESVINNPLFYTYGSLSAEDVVQKLAQVGIMDAKVEEDAGGCIITLGNDDAVIQIKDSSTHIITGSSAIREKLRNALMDCLSHF